MRHQYLPILLSLALLAAQPLPMDAASKTHPAAHAAKDQWNRQIGWVTVPVFYVTDRHLDVQSGELNYSDQQRTDGLSFGVKNITIPLTAHLNNYAKQLKQMGWHILSTEGQPLQRYLKASEMQFPDQTFTRDKFFDTVAKAAQLSDRPEVLVHIHGCCVDYKNSMVNAAKLEGWYRVPIVLYDWTSPAFGPLKLPEYLHNEQTVSASQANFNAFMDEMEQHLKPQQLAISAHSMGNRLLDNFLSHRFNEWGANSDHPRLKESIFACADVDVKSFAPHCNKTAFNSRITRIYVSGQDPALALSEVVHGAASRVGRPGKYLPDLCKTDKMDVIDDAELYLKHDLPDWLIANMHRYGRPGERDTYDVLQKGRHYYAVQEKRVHSIAGTPSPSLSAR